MKGFRRTALAAVAVMAAAIVPNIAHANYCQGSFIFFGQQKATELGSPLAYQSFYCLVDDSDTLGETPNQLLPTDDQIQIRHGDISASIPSIDVVVNGAGFVDKVVTLKRVVGNSTGVMVYDSEYLDIPGGATAQDCIEVTSAELEEEGHVATFGASC